MTVPAFPRLAVLVSLALLTSSLLLLAMVVAAGPLSAAENATLKDARRALERGKARLAISRLTSALETGKLTAKETARAFYLRGLAFARAGKQAQAIADLTSALWMKGLSAEERKRAEEERKKLYASVGVAATPAGRIALRTSPGAGAPGAGGAGAAGNKSGSGTTQGGFDLSGIFGRSLSLGGLFGSGRRGTQRITISTPESRTAQAERPERGGASPTDWSTVARPDKPETSNAIMRQTPGTPRIAANARNEQGAAPRVGPLRRPPSSNATGKRSTAESGNGARNGASASRSGGASSGIGSLFGGLLAGLTTRASPSSGSDDAQAWRTEAVPGRPSPSAISSSRAPRSSRASRAPRTFRGQAESARGSAVRPPAVSSWQPSTVRQPAARVARADKPRGRYSLQIAALRSPEEANAKVVELMAKHGKLLGNRLPRVDKTVLGNMGTFYRVHVGPFVSKAESLRFCNKLRRVGVDCFLIKS